MTARHLQQLTPELWALENEVRMAGMSFHGKMTVLRSSQGKLLLYSPVPISAEVKAEIDALGEVADIVAPNAFHHLFAGEALAQFPGATLHLSAALESKRADLASQGRVVPGGDSRTLLDGEVTALAVAGMPKIEEIIVFHRPSKTLITADLLMNVHEARGWLTRVVMWLEGVWKQLAMPRLYRLLVKQRPAMRESIAQVHTWPVERIVPTHGETVEQGGSELLRRCFSWI